MSLAFGMRFVLEDQFTNPARGIKQSMGGLQKSATQMSAAVSAEFAKAQGEELLNAGTKILGGLASATQKAADFEAVMSKVAALKAIDKTTDQFKNLEAQALDLSATTEFTAVQVGEAQAFLAMAGLNTSKILSELPATLSLASAGQLELGQAADIASNAMAIFAHEGVSVTQIADSFAKAATTTNTSIESIAQSVADFAAPAIGFKLSLAEATATIGVLGNAGFQGSKATAALRTSMLKLANPNRKMAGAMKELGLNVFDANGEFVGMVEMFRQIEDGLAGRTAEESTKLISSIFGATASGQALAILSAEVENTSGELVRGAEALQFFQKSQEGAEGAAGVMAKRLLDNFNGAIKLFESAWDALNITIGNVFLDVARSAVEILTVIIGHVNDFMKTGAGKFVLGLVAAIGALLTALGGLTIAFASIKLFMVVMLPAIKAAVAAAGAFLASFGPVILIGAALVAGYILVVKSFNDFNKVLDGTAEKGTGFLLFTQRLGGVLKSLLTVWRTWNGQKFSLEGMEGALEKLGIKDLVLTLATWVVRIKEFFGAFMAEFSGAFDPLIFGFKNLFGAIMDLVDAIFSVDGSVGKAGGSIETFQTAGQRAGQILKFVFQAMNFPLTVLTNTIAFLIRGFIFLGKVGDAVGNLIKSAFADIFPNESEMVTAALNLALEMGAAFVQGFMAMVNTLTDSILGFLSNSELGRSFLDIFGGEGFGDQVQTETAAASTAALTGATDAATTIAGEQATTGDAFATTGATATAQGATGGSLAADKLEEMKKLLAEQNQKPIQINTTVEMDGTAVAEAVNESNLKNAARG